MSEEPNASAAGPSEPAPSEPAPSELASADGQVRGRRGPRRTMLIVIGAAVTAVAVITAVVLIAVLPSSQRPEYTSLPASCALVTLATLTKYLPDPTGMPLSEPLEPEGAAQAAGCGWSSTAGRAGWTISTNVFLYRSSSAVADARDNYEATVSGLHCHCQGLTVSTRSVTGLGDRAAATIVTAGPGASPTAVPPPPLPGTYLYLWSRNADIFLVASSGPDSAAQLAGMTSMARDVLAALADPAAASSRPTAPQTQEPRYARPLHPCALLSAATLAKYAPGDTASQVTNRTPPPSGAPFDKPQIDTCSWNPDAATYSGTDFTISLTLGIYPNGPQAATGFGGGLSVLSQSVSGTTVTGERQLSDLGEGKFAVVVFQVQQGFFPAVDLLVESGNAVINLDYAGLSSAAPRGPLLTGAIAMARELLAALPR